jgi:type I restriction enzyme M protein
VVRRDKLNVDLFWQRDELLEDTDSLPEPDVLDDEIFEDMQAALVLFGTVAKGLKE